MTTRSTKTRSLPAGILLLALALPAVAAELPTVNVGVLIDGPWERNDYLRQLNIQEVTSLTAGEFDVRFPEEAYLIGDWTYQTALANLDQLLNDPEVDVIMAWGVLASQAVCCYVDLPKPVVAPVILDPKLQSLPLEDGASGVRNLSYVEIENKVVEELELFRQIVPFKKVYFLSNGNLVDAIPDIAARTFELAAKAGYEVELIPVRDSVQEVLAAIPEDAEAVYVWPQFQLGIEERQQLIDGINARRLPSFSGLDIGDVQAGILASATDIEFFQRLVRRVALNVQRILLGEDAGDLPVLFSPRLKVSINMATARAIGVSPGWDVMVEARALYAEEEGLPEMTLERAVNEAVAANLDLAVQRRVVSAGAQEIPLARSDYLPQLGAGLQASQIDEDRALASFGSQAERTTSGSLSLSQLLYSDPVLANIEIQRELQRSREEEFESVRLDIALDAATTYLNLLRAVSLVSIQRSNLEVTRSNLELARIRRTIGAANPAEVLRWEAQIAADRKSLVDSQADQRAAEILLNRLLHRDLEERFAFGEVALDDPGLITGQERFRGYTDTPARFRLLRDFMVQEGLTVAPELSQLDAAIRAQERAVLNARRAYWAPTVALEASLDEIFSRDGAGDEPIEPGLGDLAFPAADDTSWSVGIGARLPLYVGGARRATLVQAEEELTRLNLLFDSVAEQIATRIRVGMELARASFAGIALSEEAAIASGKSLELVSDAYARGAVSILDLLDAQNAAVGAEQLYANAVYDFFVDLMEVQRASNRFDFFLSAEDRELWYERLEDYFERAGSRPLGSTEAGER